MMRALTAAELLSVWERVWSQRPFEQALAILAAACPDTPLETLARLTIGQRDERLLTLRQWLFGSQITTLATCPQCSERLELQFAIEDIRVAATEHSDGSELRLHTHDYDVCYRLPNSLDLAAIDPSADVTARRWMLIERCVLQIEQNGAQLDTGQLPAEVSAALIEQMSQRDPQADIELQLTCPDCGNSWSSLFDVVSFLFAEIQAWAHRMLGDVHVLAYAYGWSEAEILAMSPTRRQIYLNMVAR